MILGRNLIAVLVLDINFSEMVIICDEGPYEGFSAPMEDVSNYDFLSIIDKTVKPEESFINSYVDKSLEPDSVISLTLQMRRIIDTKYREADINKVMDKQCQHLNAT